MRASRCDAFFLPARPGERFCLHHVPTQVDVWRALVYVHPFAEEMNKSRHMVALQARELATHGTAVLQIDLHGCGDSSGHFGEASWSTWVNDVKLAARWLAQAHAVPVGYWGLRAGCLLAAEAAQGMEEPNACGDVLFWQPVTSGRVHANQFTRLLSAAAWTGNAQTVSAKEAQAAWDRGESIDVAGYTVPGAVMRGLSDSVLTPPLTSSPTSMPTTARQGARGLWLEVGAAMDEAVECSPALMAAAKPWASTLGELQLQRVAGPQFWQSQEIEVAPALLDAAHAQGFMRPRGGVGRV